MSKAVKAVALTLILAGAFYAGVKYERFMALDRCLDMGGGRHPGGYPVCVVEIPVIPDNINIAPFHRSDFCLR